MFRWIWEGRWETRVQCVSRLVELPFYNINSASVTNLINRNECRYTIKTLTVNSRRGKPSAMFGMAACKVKAIISNHLLWLLWFFVFVGMKSCASFWKIMCLVLGELFIICVVIMCSTKFFLFEKLFPFVEKPSAHFVWNMHHVAGVLG